MNDENARLNLPWAITPDALKDIVSIDSSKAQDSPKMEELSASDFEERLEFDPSNGLAVIRIHGPVMVNPALWERYFYNAVDLERVESLVRDAAANPGVKALLLDINSPGGTVTGTPEVGNAVADFAKSKPVYAFTNSLMASAAYWIGSQANKIYATESARVGSIGVIRPHIDASEAYKRNGLKIELFTAGKYKAAGAYATALTEEQREHIQEEVNKLGDAFRATVTSSRGGVSTETMQGQVFYGKESEELGLVDRIVPNKAAVFSMANAAAEVGVNAQVDNPELGMSENADQPEKPETSEEVDETPDAVDTDMPEATDAPEDTPETGEDAPETPTADSEDSEETEENGEDSTDDSEEEGTGEDSADDEEEDEEEDEANEPESPAAPSAETINVSAAQLTQLIETNKTLQARIEVLEGKEATVEGKAAEIAAQTGTEPLEVSPDSEGSAAESGKYANMSVAELWAHVETIKGKDSAETSKLQHEFYMAHIKPRQGLF